MMKKEPFDEQVKRWPKAGRHILARFDDESIWVYQAYRPEIGRYAVENQRFGGAFSYGRMSWIKPNFLWMMYRSGWGTKPGQEVTLAIRLRRAFFDELLAQAVESAFTSSVIADEAGWAAAVRGSEVRLQWDPDHDPSGGKVARRAVQLGLRGETLRRFGQEEALEIADLSGFVAAQRPAARRAGWTGLVTPAERVYRPASASTRARIRLD